MMRLKKDESLHRQYQLDAHLMLDHPSNRQMRRKVEQQQKRLAKKKHQGKVTRPMQMSSQEIQVAFARLVDQKSQELQTMQMALQLIGAALQRIQLLEGVLTANKIPVPQAGPQPEAPANVVPMSPAQG
jgi:hypothetical protein